MQSDYPAVALARVATMLLGCEAPWVVGGSTGLVLRGAKLERAPRDIDIYVDKDSVSRVHEQLSEYVLDHPEDNETERYRSTLSHYRIENTIVELVGDFRVQALQSSYTTEVDKLLYPYSDRIEVDGFPIPIVPLGHELIFNLLRERMDRVLLTAQLLTKDYSKHISFLQILLQRNSISPDVTATVMGLAQSVGELLKPSEEEPQ
jgi:hypothetical protein